MSQTTQNRESKPNESPQLRIPSVRYAPSNESVLTDLGPLRDLAGLWEGTGFNLVARPDRESGLANLFLELNQTHETLKFDPISTAVPNRGVAQADIDLYGLTYLQKISDAVTGGALHIEPGIWVKVPKTTAPAESQSVARMGSIPHGNALLAEGMATKHHSGVTNLMSASVFPSFNSAPFGVGGPIHAPNTLSGFSQYNLLDPESATNPRTPFGDSPPTPLPASIDGVAMQDIIKDPNLLLQAKLDQQIAAGYRVEETVVLNIATASSINFLDATGQTVTVSVADGGGAIGNIPFLQTNADAALTYATFWIEKIRHHNQHFLQLQYAQMVLLNFPTILPPPPNANLSWPHVSVATLRKVFG